MGRLGLMVLLCASFAYADERPAPETGSPLDVPKVPSFDMLVPAPGALGVVQLRALGRRSYQDAPVVVRGYVTYVYDCVEENLEPYKTRAQIKQLVAADPKRCEPAKLFLGDTKRTPVQHSLHVADLPPGAAWKVGDYLEVRGTFAFVSARGDRDRAGLVASASATKVKPVTPSTAALPPPHTVPALAVPAPVRAAPPAPEKTRAIGFAMKAARDHVSWGSWKDAQTEYQRVVATWPGYDIAWYELGKAFEGPGSVNAMAAPFGKAFALVPTNAVYAYKYGHAIWLDQYYTLRYAEAKRLGQYEEYLVLGMEESKLNFDRAQQMLEYAISLAPDQWRAHVSLANIQFANQDFKAEAESLTRALSRSPREYQPYANLAKVYFAWGYLDEALAVLAAWKKAMPPDDTSEVPFEVEAQIHEAKGDLTKAIDTLTIVVAQPGREATDAAYNRARLYVATKQWDKARLALAPFPAHNERLMPKVNVLLAKIPPAKKR